MARSQRPIEHDPEFAGIVNARGLGRLRRIDPEIEGLKEVRGERSPLVSVAGLTLLASVAMASVGVYGAERGGYIDVLHRSWFDPSNNSASANAPVRYGFRSPEYGGMGLFDKLEDHIVTQTPLEVAYGLRIIRPLNDTSFVLISNPPKIRQHGAEYFAFTLEGNPTIKPSAGYEESRGEVFVAAPTGLHPRDTVIGKRHRETGGFDWTDGTINVGTYEVVEHVEGFQGWMNDHGVEVLIGPEVQG